MYAVVVAVMFLGVLSMIAMGLTLQNYHAAVQKQAHVTDYYAADAVAELIRIDVYEENKDDWPQVTVQMTDNDRYIISSGTVTIITEITDNKFNSWEVKYGAFETETTEQTE